MNKSLAICVAKNNSITVSTDDRYHFYCYLNTLICLINDFNTKLSKELRKKISKQKIRPVFRND